MWPFDKKQTKNLHDDKRVVDNQFIRNINSYINSIQQLNEEFDGDQFVKNGYGGNADVFSIINYIITTASNVPLLLEVKQPDGSWEIDINSKLINLINNPNPTSGYSIFIEELLGWKMIDGNGYVYAPRLEDGVNKGQTTELWVMPSNGMRVVGGGVTEIIKGYSYERWDELIHKDNVMMLRYFNPLGTLSGNKMAVFTGQSPLKAASMVIKKSNTGALSEVKAFSNNGAIGFLSRKNVEGEFTKEQADKLDERWKQKGGGANNKNAIVSTPANVEYHKIGESPADLRVVESGLAAKRQLASVYKMPTQLLNDPDGTTFNNQQEAQKSLYTNVIIPELRTLGEALVRWLGESYYPNQLVRILPNTSDVEVLQANKKEQAEWLGKAWWLKGSEKRAIMGLDKDDSIDQYYIPSNLMTADDLKSIDEDELRRRIADAKENK